MWQEIAIVLIAISVAIFVGYKVILFFKKPVTPCDKCAGCPLKEQMMGKKLDCKDFEKKPQKTVWKQIK